MVGDSSVGKTCLLRRFVEDAWPENNIATIGNDLVRGGGGGGEAIGVFL